MRLCLAFNQVFIYSFIMPREYFKEKLSKSVLEMKFMKKSKIRAEKEQEVEDGKAMFSDVLTKEMKHGESRFIIEPSFIPCEKLIVGRLSFQGMNPDIELLMEQESENERNLDEVKKEADVSDKEMAKQYTLIGAVGRKFNTKRGNKVKNEKDSDEESRESESEPVKKRSKFPKFLKPKD